MAEHPSQVMRRAAARLREASRAATPPPWRVSYIDGVTPAVDGPSPDGHMVAEMYDQCGDPDHADRPKADAELIVILRNASEALAGWLEKEARRADEETRVTASGRWCRICIGEHCACWDGALSVALKILGEAEG